jgi:hypothetical protein
MVEPRAKKKMLLPAIEVDASTMAATWNVAFRTNRRGFTVWLTVGSGIPASVKTHTVHESLGWRVAAEVLADMYEDGLQGDWGDQIVVRGVDGWRAEILKMAAVTSENPNYDSLRILMSIREYEIAATYDRFGSLLNDEAKEYILENWGENLLR